MENTNKFQETLTEALLEKASFVRALVKQLQNKYPLGFFRRGWTEKQILDAASKISFNWTIHTITAHVIGEKMEGTTESAKKSLTDEINRNLDKLSDLLKEE